MGKWKGLILDDGMIEKVKRDKMRAIIDGELGEVYRDRKGYYYRVVENGKRLRPIWPKQNVVLLDAGREE
jgi:ribosomal protein L17